MAIHFYNHWYDDAFNNFSALAIEFEGKLYPTAEHDYQAAKCTDPQGKEEIKLSRSPSKAKEISNVKYKLAKQENWNDIKLGVMEKILRTKLAQHQEVHVALIRSGNEKIIEASPNDYFWGCGQEGSGQNQLGKLWMKIRSELT